MFNDEELNGLFNKAKTFWNNFDKKSLINDFHLCTNILDQRKFESSFVNLHNFFLNIVDPFKLLEASELRVTKLKESLDFYCEEFETLKRNDTIQKRKIDELSSTNESLTNELSNVNKTIASYQHIQLRHLHEIEQLKRSLAEKNGSEGSNQPQQKQTTQNRMNNSNLLQKFSDNNRTQSNSRTTSATTTSAGASSSTQSLTSSTSSKSTSLRARTPNITQINEDIDTEELSRKLNEFMKTHKLNINDLKGLFDVSYQTVDDILNRPKQWSGLSQRIKIVYMKIATYLNSFNLQPSQTLPIFERSKQPQQPQQDNNVSVSNLTEVLMSEDENDKHKKAQNDISNRMIELQPMIEYDIESHGTQPLNTTEVILAVKQKLRDLQITQRIFAKALFNTIGQEVFPFRAWSKANDKYRKRIIKMYMWLHDSHGEQKLKDYNEGKFDPNNYPEERIKPICIPLISDRLGNGDIDERQLPTTNDDCIILSDIDQE